MFTANMIRINPEFYQQPAIARLLADTDKPELKRMESLVFEASSADWDQAEQRCDAEQYWKTVDAVVMEQE